MRSSAANAAPRSIPSELLAAHFNRFGEPVIVGIDLGVPVIPGERSVPGQEHPVLHPGADPSSKRILDLHELAGCAVMGGEAEEAERRPDLSILQGAVKVHEPYSEDLILGFGQFPSRGIYRCKPLAPRQIPGLQDLSDEAISNRKSGGR